MGSNVAVGPFCHEVEEVQVEEITLISLDQVLGVTCMSWALFPGLSVGESASIGFSGFSLTPAAFRDGGVSSSPEP